MGTPHLLVRPGNPDFLDLPWDIAESAPGQTVAPLAQAPRPERELYDLTEDPTESRNLLGPGASDKAEAIANDLALLLNDWRQRTNDVIPSDFAGTRIADRYTQTYLRIHELSLTSRSAIALEWRALVSQAPPSSRPSHAAETSRILELS